MSADEAGRTASTGGRPYGVGIFGAGWVAAKYVQAFRDTPLTKIVGIRSRTPGRGAALLAAHGVTAREYDSDDALFADEMVDIVVSCTPPDARREHVVRAAETGRHVIMEKPLGLTMADVTAIQGAIARAGVKSVSSFVLRWNPQIQTIRQLLADGVVGELLYAEADYWNHLPNVFHDTWLFSKAIGRSAFIAGGCHAADMIRYLAGEVVQVVAQSAAPRILTTLEYDPVVVASLTFANGAVGKLSTMLEGGTPHRFNVRLLGTEGAVQNNEVFSPHRYPGSLDYQRFPSIPPDHPDGSHPYMREIAHFLDCIETGVESHASIHDTWKSMALCFAIDQSLAEGGMPVSVRALRKETL